MRARFLISGRTNTILTTLRGEARPNYPFLTSKERDIETGLDYFGARYHASQQGRFVSADDALVDQRPSSPQSWNLYVYAANNPLRFVDPDGLAHWDKNGNFVGDCNGEYNADPEAVWVTTRKGGYWDFVKGQKIAADIRKKAEFEADMAQLAAQRAWLQEQIEKAFESWLEDQNKPKAYGGSLIIVGPITNLNRLLGPGREPLLLGTARMNLLNAVPNAQLRRLIE